MRLCIFEDQPEQFEPLSLTRPVFDLRCGMTTLADKQRRAFFPSAMRAKMTEQGVLIRAALAELYRQQHPDSAVNDADWLAGDDVLLINGRWLPSAERIDIPTTSCVGLVGEGIAYVFLTKKQAARLTFDDLPARLRHCLATLPTHSAAGQLVAYPWELVDQNANAIRHDFEWLHEAAPSARGVPALVGPLERLLIASSAKVEPMVVIDTTRGPVVIDEDAIVTAFTRLEGPCYVGPKSQVLGEIRAGTSIGPNCRVGGEVEGTIFHGFSNKYHDGFMGHAYVGEWVNLGAGTHNSDLRNDYGDISVIQHGTPVRTGLNKVGCFLGDHVKTGLATLLNTGTNVGVFCNVLPTGGFAPNFIPSFTTWWNGRLREAFRLQQSLATAEIAMQRRGVALTDAHKTLYAWLLENTAVERRRALRESEQRQLRKSA